MNQIEDFRKQLIRNNKDVNAIEKLINDELETAVGLLDNLTDSFDVLLEDIDCKDCLTYYAQLKGELFAAYYTVAGLQAQLAESTRCD